MKRDMDLVRKILLELEQGPATILPSKLNIESYDIETIRYHQRIMIDANLLIINRSTTPDISFETDMRLTWQGHEFLDAARQDHRWQKAKDTASKLGGVTFDIFKQILIDLTNEQLRGMIVPGIS